MSTVLDLSHRSLFFLLFYVCQLFLLGKLGACHTVKISFKNYKKKKKVEFSPPNFPYFLLAITCL